MVLDDEARRANALHEMACTPVAEDMDPSQRQRAISALQTYLKESARAEAAAQKALDGLAEAGTATSRAGHLRTLSERIGSRPERPPVDDWRVLTERRKGHA